MFACFERRGVEMLSFACGRAEMGTLRSTHRCRIGYQNEKSVLVLLIIYLFMID